MAENGNNLYRFDLNAIRDYILIKMNHEDEIAEVAIPQFVNRVEDSSRINDGRHWCNRSPMGGF
jgi:hypothetical protein